MTLGAGSQHLHHRRLQLHDSWSSKAQLTGISLRPPCTKLLQPSRQALGAGLEDALQLPARSRARSGARSPGEAFSNLRCWLARESISAEPQRGSPRHERFFIIFASSALVAPFLASSRTICEARHLSLLQTHVCMYVHRSDQARPEEATVCIAGLRPPTPAPATTSEAPRLPGAAGDCHPSSGQRAQGLLIRQPHHRPNHVAELPRATALPITEHIIVITRQHIQICHGRAPLL